MSGQNEIPALGSARAGLRFELVRAAESVVDLENPFVTLNDSGRFSRVLLARIAMGEDRTERYFALKLQRSSYRPAGAGVTPSLITNTDIDEQWGRERASLREAACEEIVSLFDLGESAFRSLPVTFCKQTGTYFHPPCPRCLTLLTTCRDDGFLRDASLPAFSKSTTRYLHCPNCISKKVEPAILYTYPRKDEHTPKGNVEVRRREALYRDLAATVTGDLAADLRRLVPSFEADYWQDPDRTASVLLPVSYYDFHMLPLEVLQLHLDEFSDLLGGADWNEIKHFAVQQPGATGRERILEPLTAGFSSPFQWVYRDDPAGHYPLEVLRLKMIAFTQMCRGLFSYHSRCRQPHLDLNPTSVMVRVPTPSRDLPARWGFQVKILDLASPHRFRPATGGSELAHELLMPPLDASETYLSPIIRKTSFQHEEPMKVTIRSVEAHNGGARFEADAVSGRARVQDWHPRDVIRVVASTQVPWLENTPLWGTLEDFVERGIRFSATLPEMPKGLEDLQPPFAFEGGVSFYRRFHVPCDLFPLGMMLFRMILSNDAEDMFAVEDAVHRVLNKTGVDLERKPDRDFARIRKVLHWHLQDEKTVLERSAVLYNKADREKRGNLIPVRVWADLLVFGFRLASNIPGFSFCKSHADYPADRPEAVMENVLAELDGLNRRLHLELFAKEERNREIAQVCADLISEVTQADLGDAPA